MPDITYEIRKWQPSQILRLYTLNNSGSFHHWHHAILWPGHCHHHIWRKFWMVSEFRWENSAECRYHWLSDTVQYCKLKKKLTASETYTRHTTDYRQTHGLVIYPSSASGHLDRNRGCPVARRNQDSWHVWTDTQTDTTERIIPQHHSR